LTLVTNSKAAYSIIPNRTKPHYKKALKFFHLKAFYCSMYWGKLSVNSTTRVFLC